MSVPAPDAASAASLATASLAWPVLYLQLASLLLPVAACAAAGLAWTLARRPFPTEFVGGFAMTVAIPALVFHTLLTTRLSPETLAQVAGAALMGLCTSGVVAALLLKLTRQPVGSMLPAATFSNAGNLGLPVAALAWGEAGLAVALVYFVMSSVLQHTAGVWWILAAERRWPTRIGHDRVPLPTPRRLNLPAGPVLTACACALALALRASGSEVPAPVLGSAQMLGSLAVPMMLLSLGHALATVSRHQVLGGATLGGVRLLAGAVSGWIVVTALQLPPSIGGVLQLQLLMPVAVVNYLYAARFTALGGRTAGAVLFSTVLFVLLAPMLLVWTGAKV